jgi:hypothetical protein
VIPNVYSAHYLGNYTEYHQKATNFCLAATAQSILAWDFGTATYVGSSVLTSQTNIANVIQTGPSGADDYVAFSWINGQFARWNSPFRYVSTNDTSLSSFETRVTGEVDTYYQPLYVRVDVSSPYYVWHQSKPALHATVSTGYSSYGSYVDIGDPLTASTSGCPEGIGYPGYSSTPDYGCIYWTWPTGNYYKAKSGVVDGELPEEF